MVGAFLVYQSVRQLREIKMCDNDERACMRVRVVGGRRREGGEEEAYSVVCYRLCESRRGEG